MPDEVGPKHPVPKIPDVVSFIRRFGDHKACAMHLKEVRWAAQARDPVDGAEHSTRRL